MSDYISADHACQSADIRVTGTTIGDKHPMDVYVRNTAVPTITWAHYQTHIGNFYTVTHYFGSVSNGGAADYLIKVGVSTLHAGFSINVGGDCELEIYEGTTTTNDGTELTAFNANRVSTNVSTANFYHTPTIDTLSSKIHHDFIPGGGFIFSVGGSDGEVPRGVERILKTETNYLVRITNVSGISTRASIGHGFYEV